MKQKEIMHCGALVLNLMPVDVLRIFDDRSSCFKWNHDKKKTWEKI